MIYNYIHLLIFEKVLLGANTIIYVIKKALLNAIYIVYNIIINFIFYLCFNLEILIVNFVLKNIFVCVAEVIL